MVRLPTRIYRDAMLTLQVRLIQAKGLVAQRWSGRAAGVGEGDAGHGGSPPPAHVSAQVCVPRQISSKFSFSDKTQSIPHQNVSIGKYQHQYEYKLSPPEYEFFNEIPCIHSISGSIHVPRQIWS